MTSDEMTNKLLDAAFTRGEILRRIGEIRDFLEQKFFKPNPKDLTEFLLTRNVDGDPDALNKLGMIFLTRLLKKTCIRL